MKTLTAIPEGASWVERLRPHAAAIAWAALAVALIIAGFVSLSRQSPEAPQLASPTPIWGGPVASAVSHISVPALSFSPEPWVPLAVPPSPEEARVESDPGGFDRHKLMEEQVRRMREYREKFGPDDPFALSEERIQQFQQRGDPVIW